MFQQEKNVRTRIRIRDLSAEPDNSLPILLFRTNTKDLIHPINLIDHNIWYDI